MIRISRLDRTSQRVVGGHLHYFPEGEVLSNIVTSSSADLFDTYFGRSWNRWKRECQSDFLTLEDNTKAARIDRIISSTNRNWELIPAHAEDKKTMSAHVYIQAMNAFTAIKHISMKTILVQWRKVLYWLRREDTPKIRSLMTGVRYICAIPGHSIRPPSYLNPRVISSTIKRKWSATLVLRRITAAWRMVYGQEEPAAEDAEKLVSPQSWSHKNQIRIRTQTIIKIPRISFEYFCLNTVVNQTMTEFTIQKQKLTFSRKSTNVIILYENTSPCSLEQGST